MAAISGVRMGAARSMPACSVPQRAPKVLVSRAPVTGRTALGRAASAAACAAALAAAWSAAACAWAAAACSAPRSLRLTASSPSRAVASASVMAAVGSAVMPSSSRDADRVAHRRPWPAPTGRRC